MIKILNIDCNVEPERISEGVTVDRVSIKELGQLSEVQADIVVWNNNRDFNPDLLSKMRKIKLFVNWGAYDKNIPSLDTFKKNGIDVRTTSGYCTQTVANFGLRQLQERNIELTSQDTVGFIGMGRIAYTLARKIQQNYSSTIAYSTPSRKFGLTEFFYQDLPTLLADSKVIILLANHTESLVNKEALRKNPHTPTILNLCRENIFPLKEVKDLLQDGTIGDFISDNKPPSSQSELTCFYTGHKAYRSEEAKAHKHSILQGYINQIKTQNGQDIPIYLARHGQTEWNKQGRLQGRLNSNLTSEGKVQAKRLANFLKDKKLDAIYSSPLGRSVETAQIVSEILGIKFYSVESFMEIDFGALQGKLKSSIESYPEFLKRRSVDKLRTSYPGGESYYDVALRIQYDLDKILAKGDPFVIIGHECTNRMIRSQLLRKSLEGAPHIAPQKNTQIITYHLGNETESLHNF